MADPVGIAFPFRADETGFPRANSGLELITDSIQVILLTEVGERLMRPNFGSRLRSYLFENVDDFTMEAIKAEVFRALLEQEPRVIILNIDVAEENIDDANSPHLIIVNLLFDVQGRRVQLNVPIGV